MSRFYSQVISGSAPSTATTAVVGSSIVGLEQFDEIDVSATFAGNTGGTLDVYLQRYDEGLDLWVDWVHFAQKTAAAASSTVAVSASNRSSTITTVGTGTSPALAVGTIAGGHPGHMLRCLAVSGASTTVGATVTISVRGKRG
jgi:hypothetical protein